DQRPPNSLNSYAVSTTGATYGQFVDMSTYSQLSGSTSLLLNIPADVTAPLRRFGMQPNNNGTRTDPTVAGLSQTTYSSGGVTTNSFPTIFEDSAVQLQSGGDDVLLNNVLSFEVKVAWDDPKTLDSRFPTLTTT